MSFIDSARLLIKYGADPNLPAGPDGESPLASAITDSKAEFARLYLTYGGDAGQMMSDGNTLLIKTINKTAPKDLAELLLNYGSDANGKSAEGATPLFEAIQARRLDILTLCLTMGRTPTCQDRSILFGHQHTSPRFSSFCSLGVLTPRRHLVVSNSPPVSTILNPSRFSSQLALTPTRKRMEYIPHFVLLSATTALNSSHSCCPREPIPIS